MYQVKRLEKDTIIEQTEINTGKIKAVGSKTASKCFAVVDGNGQVVKSQGGQFELYPIKSVAQKVADWYNAR